MRLTQRLTESAACLVADAGGDDGPHGAAACERIGRGDGGAEAGAGTEPGQPGRGGGTASCTRKDRHDPRVEAYARLFYEQAVIAEGSKVPNPAGFAKRVNELIARDAKV